tara:strand:+ start:211 stop:348 length:138 start_codon:yes stop_codon:yes gene_type:complete
MDIAGETTPLDMIFEKWLKVFQNTDRESHQVRNKKPRTCPGFSTI